MIDELYDLTLKLDNSQPFLIPMNQEPTLGEVPKIIVHLAVSDPDLEDAMLSLLGRTTKFSVVKGSIGYAAEAHVRLIDEQQNTDHLREYDEPDPPKLLFIGIDQSTESLTEAARAGAWAYVSEFADSTDLEATICSVVESSGSPLLKRIADDKEASQELLNDLSSLTGDSHDPNHLPNPLKRDEIRILDLVARGEPSKNIGEIVGLAEQTIKNYVVRILDKTRTHNRAHAAAVAAQRGWLSSLDEEL